MSWPAGTVPPAVTALRDMVVASATFTAAGGVQANVDYPMVDLSATFPRALLSQESEHRQVYSAGSAALPTGTLTVEFYQKAKASVVETNAFAIASEIAAATSGLLIRSVSCGMAMVPTLGETAAQADGAVTEFHVVSITIDFGPNV